MDRGVLQKLSEPVELKELRSYNSKHILIGSFANGEQVRQMNAHTGHIHYKDKITGKLENIDNTLIPKGDYFEMDKASYGLKIPRWSDEFIRFDNQFEGADHSIELRPVGQRKEFIKTDKCHLLAKDVFGQGIDIELGAGYNSFRKEVVINEKPTDLSKDLELKFEIKADGLKLKYAPYELDQATLDKILPLQELVYDTHKKRLKALTEKKVLNEIEQQEIKDIQDEREFLVGKIDRLRRKVWDKTNTRESILDFWFDDEQGKRSHFRRFMVWDSKGNAQKIKVRLTNENGKLFLTKIIPKEFLEKAIYPVRTDTTTSYAATAGDGFVYYQSPSSESWDVVHDKTVGTGVDYTGTVEYAFVIRGGGGIACQIYRSFIPIDTSALPTGAVISAATLNLYIHSIAESCDDDAQAYSTVVQTTQASTNSLITEDYDQCGAVDNPTKGSNDINTVAGLTVDAWGVWTLNAAGRSWIVDDGITKLGIREGHDIEDISSAVCSYNWANFRSSEYADTASDPYLSVTYTTPTTYVKTIQAKARVKQAGLAKTIQAKARVKQAGLAKTIQAKARVKQAGLAKTIQAKATVKQFDVSQTIQAKARIGQTNLVKTIQAKARILKVVAQTIQAKARIWSQRAGYVKMRSYDQKYPLTLNDEKEYRKMRSYDQDYPLTLNEGRIL